MSPGLSINHYLCPPGYGVARFAQEIAGAGASGIGLTIRALDETGVAQCRRIVADNGLFISSLNSAGDFLLRDPALARDQAARNLSLVEAAAQLGARVLVVVVGGLSGQSFVDDLELRAPRLLERADALRRIGEGL